MAGEVQISFATGRTVYVLIRNSNGQIWNGSNFVSYATVNYLLYTVALAEQGSASGYYFGNFPTAIVPGTYSITGKSQTGGSAAETDPTIAVGNLEWNGSGLAPLSDTATSGQVGTIGPIRLARGIALSGFPFKMVSAVDHVTPFVSGVVSGQISRDGGGFGPFQSGNFAEVGLGWYKCNLTSGDLLATTVALAFTATGVSGGVADQRDMMMILQRTSGQ